MTTNFIKEYLIKLGVDVSADTITQFDKSLSRIDKGIVSFFKRWNNAFLMFSKSYANLVKTFIDFGTRISKADMEMQRWAKTMFLTNESARALDKTLSAMDLDVEDLRDVALNPELTKQYRELLALSKSLSRDKGFDEAAKGFRAISFEFQKMKLIFEYLKERIVKYFWQFLQSTPARDLVNLLKRFNQRSLASLDKVAKFFGTIAGFITKTAYTFMRAFEVFYTKVIEPMFEGFKKLPEWLQITLSAAAIGVAALMAGPFGKLMLILSTVGLFLEDYMGYKTGMDSSHILKPVWEIVDRIPEILSQIGQWLKDLIDDILNSTVVNFLRDKASKLWGGFSLPSFSTPQLDYLGSEEGKYLLPVIDGGLDEAARESMEREERDRRMNMVSNTNNLTINVNGVGEPKEVADRVVASIRNNRGVFA